MRWFHSTEIVPLSEMPLAQLRAFLKGYPGDWRRDTNASLGVPPPPPEKPREPGAPVTELTNPGQSDDSPDAESFTRIATRRRSCREFRPDPIPLATLEYLLWNTQAVTRTVTDADGRVDHQLRTVPSGGARHPFETYLFIEQVAGLRPGLYRYLASRHALLHLQSTAGLAQEVAKAAYQQDFLSSAAVIFLWAALPARTEWHYAYIAHRMIAIEAGHIGQNLLLGAEALHLGACPILGYDQRRMDQLAGLDGTAEFTLYMAAVGVRA